MDPNELQVRVRELAGAIVVDVEGEVDIVTSVRLNRELQDLWERVPPPTRVFVDLSAAPFMDTSGLAVLLGARRAGGAVGCRFAVRSPSHAIARVLNVTGLEALLLDAG